MDSAPYKCVFFLLLTVHRPKQAEQRAYMRGILIKWIVQRLYMDVNYRDTGNNNQIPITMMHFCNFFVAGCLAVFLNVLIFQLYFLLVQSYVLFAYVLFFVLGLGFSPCLKEKKNPLKQACFINIA